MPPSLLLLSQPFLEAPLKFLLLCVCAEDYIVGTFALVIFHSDGLVALKDNVDDERDVKATRFFSLAARLSLELQMVLCNRTFGSGKDLILTRDSEPAFKELAQVLQFH